MTVRNGTRSILLAFILASSASTLLPAQMGMMDKGEFTEKMSENSKKLKQYTYLQKTQIFLKGELKGTKLARVHYDPATGEKVSEPLNDAPPQEQGGRRRLMGRMKEKKIEEKKDEMKEYVERLMGLMGQYLPPNPDRMKAAMPNALIAPPASGQAKLILNGYLKPGDKMTFVVDTSTKSLSEIAIDSSLDDKPVSFQVVFSKLADGPNYPSLTNINAPAKELRIAVATSDYHK
jgi:hypothetical protein